jgi:hypothetical protein
MRTGTADVASALCSGSRARIPRANGELHPTLSPGGADVVGFAIARPRNQLLLYMYAIHQEPGRGLANDCTWQLDPLRRGLTTP